jgi:hypothetical protein
MFKCSGEWRERCWGCELVCLVFAVTGCSSGPCTFSGSSNNNTRFVTVHFYLQLFSLFMFLVKNIFVFRNTHLNMFAFKNTLI